jgi:hypothetical protein
MGPPPSSVRRYAAAGSHPIVGQSQFQYRYGVVHSVSCILASSRVNTAQGTFISEKDVVVPTSRSNNGRT